MPIKLSIWLSQRSDACHAFEFDQGEVLVGRGTTCHVRLPFHFVSSVHFTIVAEGDTFLLSDNGSTNGTILNGKRLAPFAYTPLRSGDIVSVGEIMMQLAVVELASATFSLEVTGEEARRMVLEAMTGKDAARNASLTVTQGADRGASVDIEGKGRVVIGSGEDVDLRLTDPQCHASHLELIRTPSGYEARPLDEHLTRVNGQPLVEPQGLGNEAELALGETVIRFADPLQRYLDELDRLPEEGPNNSDAPKDQFLSTQQIDDVHYLEEGEAPPEFGPPDRPPAPGQLKLINEVEASGFHPPISAQGWGAFEYLIVVVTGVLVFGGMLAVLVLLNVIDL